LIELVEIIRGEEQIVLQLKPSQWTAVDDGIDEFLLFLFRVGVVEAQVACAFLDLVP